MRVVSAADPRKSGSGKPDRSPAPRADPFGTAISKVPSSITLSLPPDAGRSKLRVPRSAAPAMRPVWESGDFAVSLLVGEPAESSCERASSRCCGRASTCAIWAPAPLGGGDATVGLVASAAKAQAQSSDGPRRDAFPLKYSCAIAKPRALHPRFDANSPQSGASNCANRVSGPRATTFIQVAGTKRNLNGYRKRLLTNVGFATRTGARFDNKSAAEPDENSRQTCPNVRSS